jgi:uncharacterized damage-inducible protein DinB
MTKFELLQGLRKEYQQWETYLDLMGPARMDQSGVNGDWSVKDIVAHLTGWNRWLVTRFLAAQRSEPEPPPPWPAHLQVEDEINAWIYATNRGRTVREVLDDTHQVFQQLLSVLEDLPDEVRIERVEPKYNLVWVGDKRFPVGEFFDHFYDDHMPDIRAWLARVENQPEATLVELIHYNNWANAQVIAACQMLTPEQLAAAAPGTYGTIRATLAHIIAAEADYVDRLMGDSPQPSFQWDDQPALTSLSAYSDQVANALLDAIQRTPPSHIVHEEEGGNTMDYQARVLFIQVINHGIEHRTNITTILSGLGLPAPEVDGWGYLVSHPHKFELKEGFQK